MSDILASSDYRRDRTGAADHVLHDLRAQILSGHLVRGTRLPSEKELAVHYQVSSPTIREAIRALNAMSLVEVRHGSGTFVTAESGALLSSALTAVVELENVGLLSILELSEALYLKSVDLSMKHASDEELADLQRAARQFRSDMDNEQVSDSLRAFLLALVALSHNQLLITIAGYLIESQIALARGAAETAPSMWRKIAGRLIDERIALADALAARDHDAAHAGLRQYMRRGHDLVAKYATVQVSD